MTGNNYQKLAMRTNDHKATDRLLDKVDMIDFFKQAKSGRDTENYDLGGIFNACLGLSGIRYPPIQPHNHPQDKKDFIQHGGITH